MTAREIQRRLIHDKLGQATVMPNYTPRTWFESDVLEVTKARLWVEYEVKVSRADFFADADKRCRHWVQNPTTHQWGYADENKHVEIAAGKGPNRFYFVVPEMLVTEIDVPNWSGLIYAHERKGVRSPFNIVLHVKRKAPYLHRRKFQDSDMCLIHQSAYHRYIRVWGKL